MKADRNNRGLSPQYVMRFTLFVHPSGSVVVVMGNQTLYLDESDVQALFSDVVDRARFFRALYEENRATALSIMQRNSTVEATNGTHRVAVD